MSKTNGTRTSRKAGIVRKRLASLKPSPENDKLYGAVDRTDPEIQRLAVSIKKHGIKEPLVVTADNYILSGHRRYVAATLAGKVTVPCRVMRFNREGIDKDKYVEHLREHNRQRDKRLSEKLREELVSINPNQAYRSLILHRLESAEMTADTVGIEGRKRRSRITSVKDEMLEAVKQIIFVERRKFWPMSVRAVHYALLNVQPLRNTRNAESRYVNDKDSYKDLSNLLTRARLAGSVPLEGNRRRNATTSAVERLGGPSRIHAGTTQQFPQRSRARANAFAAKPYRSHRREEYRLTDRQSHHGQVLHSDDERARFFVDRPLPRHRATV